MAFSKRTYKDILETINYQDMNRIEQGIEDVDKNKLDKSGLSLNGTPTNVNFIKNEEGKVSQINANGQIINLAGEKGEQGKPGTASVAIDDSVTNFMQTWTSGKINSHLEHMASEISKIDINLFDKTKITSDKYIVGYDTTTRFPITPTSSTQFTYEIILPQQDKLKIYLPESVASLFFVILDINGKVLKYGDYTRNLVATETTVPFLDHYIGYFTLDIDVLKATYNTAYYEYVVPYKILFSFPTSEIDSVYITHFYNKYYDVPNIELVVPKVIPCVVNHQINLYFENILLYGRLDKVQEVVFPVIKDAKRFRDKWQWTPKTTGNYGNSVYLYENDTKEYRKSDSISIIAIPENAGEGLNKKVLIIGDSRVDNGAFVSTELNNLFTSDPMNVTLLGTRGSGTNLHEGRVGWATYDYLYKQTYNGITNAFYNPSKSGDIKFDFSYYMTQQGYSSVDYVFINLGTNDVGWLSNADSSRTWSYYTIKTYIQTIVDDIHSYDPNIKVCIGTPYAKAMTNRTEWSIGREKEESLGLIKVFKQYFDNKGSQKTFLVPNYINIDLERDFVITQVDTSYRNTMKESYVADVLHPALCGYQKDADVIYNYIKYLASLGF